jgi:FMNH2-dependent dimethyl sulfone monooxygenase
MRYGYWLPVFGGWLRNVDNEHMEPSWDYARRLAQRSERIGYDLTLIAELFLNDIKGIEAPSLDAWTTAAALAAVTDRLELMVAVRPTFHNPAILAKQAANIDRISNGRLALNVVSSWWRDEARRYGVRFDEHDERYARTAEWLAVVDGVWRDPRFSFDGRFYRVEETVAEPKPIRWPRPTIYAGGESEAAKQLIAATCDAYVMHGDPPDRIADRIADVRARREALGLRPMQFGMAAYAIVRSDERKARAELERITNVSPGSPGYRNYQDWVTNTKLEQRLTLEDYSVSNRGLRAGLVGTPESLADRIREYERIGVDLLLLQCSPQAEEMERFAAEVMPLVGASGSDDHCGRAHGRLSRPGDLTQEVARGATGRRFPQSLAGGAMRVADRLVRRFVRG